MKIKKKTKMCAKSGGRIVSSPTERTNEENVTLVLAADGSFALRDFNESSGNE